MGWTTTHNKTSTAIMIAGAMAFNTYAAIDESTRLDLSNTSKEVNNLCGDVWLSTNTNIKKDVDNKVKEIIGVSDVIKKVKINLGLPNKDVAQVFGVTRQTVHNYTKQSEIKHTVNADTLERALQLDEIFTNLEKIFSKSPGAMAKNFTIQGESLLNLLSKSELNTDQISSFAYQLSKRMMANSSDSNAINSDLSLAELTRHT